MRMCACRGTAGFAHVSCLAEQAKILVAEVEENNLGDKAFNERWHRWDKCSLCEQHYHGVVSCALGWACWKTYVGRPEEDGPRVSAMTLLGTGLKDAGRFEEALSIQETQLSIMRRYSTPVSILLSVQSNLGNTYYMLGRFEEALSVRRDVHSAHLRFESGGPTRMSTLIAALNFSTSLTDTGNFAEARAFMPDQMALAKRALGADHPLTLDFQWGYSRAFTRDKDATAEELTEVATILENALKIAQRVMGREHPRTGNIRHELATAREEIARRRGA